MIDYGFFAMRRALFNHPIFKGQHERFYVWGWMIATAAFQDTKQDASGQTVIVKRGQLLTSYRQMSEETGVGIQIIRTLIKRLQTEHAIDTATNTGRLLITICNYDKYQTKGEAPNTAKNTELTQHQHTKEERNNIPVGKDQNPSPISRETDQGKMTTVTAAMWEVGKNYLESHRVKNGAALIGRWRSKAGSDLAVLGAIEAAQKAGTEDPVPYIQAMLRTKPEKSRSNTRNMQASEDDQRRARRRAIMDRAKKEAP